jgi:hypothetical protein
LSLLRRFRAKQQKLGWYRSGRWPVLTINSTSNLPKGRSASIIARSWHGSQSSYRFVAMLALAHLAAQRAKVGLTAKANGTKGVRQERCWPLAALFVQEICALIVRLPLPSAIARRHHPMVAARLLSHRTLPLAIISFR